MKGKRLLGVAVVWLVCGAGGPNAQPGEYTNNFKYNTGQSIQPIFEGWSQLPDGSYHMHFGYLNRNYAEQPENPVGPGNRLEPGGPDRGQPTFFYTRTNRNLFTVAVPKDWPRTAELIWTVTHHGQTQRAVGWLQAEWEIDPAGGAATGGNTHPEYRNNQQPTLSINPVPALRLSTPVRLSTTVADDGLPAPRPRGKRAVGQETPPTLQMQGTIETPVNVPTASTARAQTRPDGLSVTWMVWRGPADVLFEPRYAQPKDGRTQTTATFTTPGQYVLRAAAFDGALTAYAEVKVALTGGNQDREPGTSSLQRRTPRPGPRVGGERRLEAISAHDAALGSGGRSERGDDRSGSKRQIFISKGPGTSPPGHSRLRRQACIGRPTDARPPPPDGGAHRSSG